MMNLQDETQTQVHCSKCHNPGEVIYLTKADGGIAFPPTIIGFDHKGKRCVPARQRKDKTRFLNHVSPTVQA